ncbi:MAG TPA: inositol monophosphatase family protein [Micropepsaceae bacterium]|nr:inositol monophosphatase family protein [Micropepsaceae bacterium]
MTGFSTTYSPVMNVMVSAVRKAARNLKRDFGEVENLQVSEKGPGDFVTQADLRTEKTLIDELRKARPHYSIVSEEAGHLDGSDKTHRFIIDPVDGTTNFIHAIPHFAISVALEREGQLAAGVIYNPVTDELFIAEKGFGAFLNNRRLRVSARRDMRQAVFATGIPFGVKEGQDRFARELTRLMPKVAGIRRFGSAALDLAYVAAGRFDGFWESGLGSWDMAAGIVLVREAGGLVTDLAGGQGMLAAGNVVAANPHLMATLRDEVTAAGKA